MRFMRSLPSLSSVVAASAVAEGPLDPVDSPGPVAGWGVLALGVLGVSEAGTVDHVPRGQRAAGPNVSPNPATAQVAVSLRNQVMIARLQIWL